MNIKEMKESLEKKSKELSSELIQLEKEFNLKKEYYLKLEGALEVLSELSNDSLTATE